MKNQNYPKITVLMAVYNGEKCLRRTIDSILKQTFKDFEFLIINDCSTDNTLKVIHSFKDPRIKIHNNETNKGQTISLNIGLKHAKGKYIARMDADDLAMPQRLEKQYKFIVDNPKYTVVGSSCLVIDENNRKRSISQGISNYRNIIVKMLTASPLNHVSALMNKKEIIDAGGYDSDFIISADFDLWSKLVRSGKFITSLDETLSAYKVSTASLSHSYPQRKIVECSRIIKKNISHFAGVELSDEEAINIYNLFSDGFINMNQTIIMKTENKYREIIYRLKLKAGIELDKSFINSILSNNYWIAAYHLILNKKNYDARKLLKQCINNNGIKLKTIVIYLLSFSRAKTVLHLNYLRARLNI